MGKYELIQKLCDSKGVKVTNVEKELGFAKGSFKKMDSSKPSADKIYAIARYFSVPMEIFYEDPNSVRFARYYEGVQNLVDDYAKEPVYDIAAGQGRINGDYADNYIKDEGNMEGYSWCEVHGDSMYPILLDGDLVKVEHLTQTEPTDLTVIKVDGESSTIKYVEVAENGIWLRAENKDVFEDKFYSVQEVLTLPVSIIGKVVELKRKF